jgi:hypothetical protein
MEVTSYVRTDNGKKIIIFNGDRQSFRCRQRNTLNDQKVNSLKFVSFKEMEKESRKFNKKIIGPLKFYTLSRM